MSSRAAGDGQRPTTPPVEAKKAIVETLLLEKHFWDGRKARVLKLDGSRVVVRVFTRTGRLYIEHPYDDINEATTTVFEWTGDGYPLSERQRGGGNASAGAAANSER